MMDAPRAGDWYWEDFAPGDVLVHKRGRTIGESEHIAWTCRLLNTAEIHFNRALVEAEGPDAPAGGRLLVYGGFVLAICMGLSTGETTENAIAILGLDDARHTTGVHAGDTLFARTEVIEKRESDRPDAGIVKFKLSGLKQDRKTVCVEAIYDALVRKRPSGP